MLVNAPNNYEPEHVKFVSYTGKWPNLCSGILTLEIDGRTVTFGCDDACDNYKFWHSGGTCNYISGATCGEWIIDYADIPEKYQKYANEIDYVFNKNVEEGCCGGCI